MANYDPSENKLIIKIVYYGPAMSGKTTNLMRLHDWVRPDRRGELMTFETKGDRTLFFDLLPVVIRTDDNLQIKIKLFTAPGQVAHDATRKTVLSRADGVVFVADSQISQAVNNFESFDNLEKNAARVGLEFNQLPLVVQFNKRDLENTVSEQEVLDRWRPTGLTVVFSSALRNQGVSDTFQKIVMDTLNSLIRSNHVSEPWQGPLSVFLQRKPDVFFEGNSRESIEDERHGH